RHGQADPRLQPPGQARHTRGLAPDHPVIVTVEKPDQTETGRFRSFHDLVTQRLIVFPPDVAVPSHSSPFEEALTRDAQTRPSGGRVDLFSGVDSFTGFSPGRHRICTSAGYAPRP